MMKLNAFSTTLRGLALAVVLIASLVAAAGQSRKPNVIFMMADDLGYGDLGSFGQEKIRTPNLDRLAAGGMRLTRHYSGSPVCAPARCVLMTGKHTGRAFIRSNRELTPEEGQYPIPADSVTMAKLFKAQGYATGAFGKWGLGGPGTHGEPLKQGFDRFFGFNCQRHSHNLYPRYIWDDDRTIDLNNPWDDPLLDPIASPQYFGHMRFPEGLDPYDPANYKRYQGNDYGPDLYSEQALRFIQDNKDRPFFLYYPTLIPHVALQVPDDSLEEYLGKWEDPPYYSGENRYLPNFAPRATYAAMVTRMDREIGRMMDLVRELGLEENTLFVFTSDNGGTRAAGGADSDFFRSNGDFRGYKAQIYEGGIRVPTIVTWKGKVAPGTDSDRLSGFEDWLPTLMELIGAGATVPRDIDGISLAPTLQGRSQPDRPFLYREYPSYGGQQALWMGEWKAVRVNLARQGGSQELQTELYNLKRDPGETTDLAARHPEIVERMARIMFEERVPSELFPIPALDRLHQAGN